MYGVWGEPTIDRLVEIHESYVEEQTGGFWNSDFGQVIQYGLIAIGCIAVGAVVAVVLSGKKKES